MEWHVCKAGLPRWCYPENGEGVLFVLKPGLFYTPEGHNGPLVTAGRYYTGGPDGAGCFVEKLYALNPRDSNWRLNEVLAWARMPDFDCAILPL